MTRARRLAVITAAAAAATCAVLAWAGVVNIGCDGGET